MKKVKRRAFAAVILVFVLLAGLIFFTARYIRDGAKWAAFSANSSAYKNGVLLKGTVLDRNGVLLSGASSEGRYYSDDALTRKSTLHAVGDIPGNIGTGALSMFASELTGYSLINGNYSVTDGGSSLYLTIDSRLNNIAYEALSGRKGTVAVYNYETGEILCMVSSPSYDPNSPGDIVNDDSSGVYLNRFLSSSFTPGSVFKIVTSAAAIEQIPDIFERTFVCEGSREIDGDVVTCTGTHGKITFEEALAHSCNCAFAELSLELGNDTLNTYAKKLGLTAAHSVSGIKTSEGYFEKAKLNIDTAWSGIGQYTDLVNPEAMLRVVGAIAGGGTLTEPTLIKNVVNNLGISTGIYPKTVKTKLLSESTARKLSDMMSYNVALSYGSENYPGLEMHAKSGTAEVGEGLSPHAWFTGFITNKDHPLAFVVVVENGGWGSSTAGSIANTVLAAAIKQ